MAIAYPLRQRPRARCRAAQAGAWTPWRSVSRHLGPGTFARSAVNAIDVHLVRARQALLNVAAVVPHTDADGLAAGAIALRARGERARDAVLLPPGVSPFAPDASLPAGPLAVLDWGVREFDRPGVLVDHHVPEAAPREDQVVVSSYGEDVEVPTAALMRRVVPDAPAWLAAVGAVGDLGAAAFEL